MTLSYEAVKDFADYMESWPEEDEPGFDGEHYGGWRTISPDAPEKAKKAYAKFVKEMRDLGEMSPYDLEELE